MDTKLFDVGHNVSGVPIPQRAGRALTRGQLRVLELEDGDNFVLHMIQIADNDDVPTKWRSSNVSAMAARLSSWARGRHVRLTYRVIDKDTVRIWRLGAV